MRTTYRVIAQIIAVLVVIQAMVMVWAIAGLFSWIDDGATLDKSVIEGWENEPPTFDGAIGHFIHVMSGTFLIPALGLILLIISFFAKVPRGVVLAAVVVVSIIVQYLAGIFSSAGGATVGIIHGLNAFISFFAKVPRGVVLATVVVVSIIVQYLAGTFADAGAATVGIIHGLNAFILFGASLAAAKAAKEAGATAPESQPAAM